LRLVFDTQCIEVDSERTIESYRDHVERIFAEWLDSPLLELGLDPAKVVAKHDDITKDNGPYIANGSMRTLRAIYNHARKSNKSLPAENPVNAIDWNGDKRRDTGMGTSDLKGWFAELAALDNPVRRKFHLFTLLSGCHDNPDAQNPLDTPLAVWSRLIPQSRRSSVMFCKT
jgi:hypothetical protein